MTEALTILTTDVQRYELVVSRPWSEWMGIEDEKPEIVLLEGAAIELATEPDKRLRRARKVRILILETDNGMLDVDITSRRWEMLAESKRARERIDAVDRILRDGMCPRRYTGASAAWLAFLPFPLYLVLTVAATLIDPALRNAMWNSVVDEKLPPTPSWVNEIGTISVYVWPFLALGAIALYLPVVLSGGLRVWPASLKWRQVAGVMFQIARSKNFSVDTRAIIVGVIASVASALLTFWITR